MHEVPAFHAVHGSCVQLSDGNSLATRTPTSIDNAIVFGSCPVKVNRKIRLELTTSDDWVGVLRIGLTSGDPCQINAATEIPPYALPGFLDREGFWVSSIDRYLCNVRQIPRFMTVCYTSEGSLMFGQDKEATVELLKGLPTDHPLWLLLDVYGMTTAVRIMYPDDVPAEILALGPQSARAYQTACESGCQSMYRTRLVLYGDDVEGKNCLKAKLMGLSEATKLALSASAIDLASSYSFGLIGESCWKKAISCDNIYPSDPHKTVDLDLNKTAVERDERKITMATNKALEILFHRKCGQKSDGFSALRDSGVNKETSHLPTNDKEFFTGDKRFIGNARGSGSTGITVTRTSDLAFSAGRKDANNLGKIDDKILKDFLANVPLDIADLTKEILFDKLRKDGKEQMNCSPPISSFLSNRSVSQMDRNIFLSVFDCSGDEAYFATNQVFLSSRSIYLLVFNLCLKLDGNFPTSLDENQTEDSFNEPKLSVLDHLDDCLNQISTFASVVLSGNSLSTNVANNLPPIFIVGTNINNLDVDHKRQRQLAEEKLNKIHEMIQRKPYSGQVISPYYAIDNDMDNEDSEDKEARKLRCHIENVARLLPYMGEFIPNTWLHFDQAVERLVTSGTNFCSYGQLQEVASDEGILTDDEFETLIKFYHELGLMIYVRSFGANRLNDTVILRPLWLVEISKSIILSADDTNKFIKKASDEGIWHQYLSNGILFESLMDLLLEKSIYQKPIVIRCLEKLDLIVERSLVHKSGSSSFERKFGRSFVIPFLFVKICTSKDVLYLPRNQDVIFYYDFNGFLPDILFYKILARTYRWSQSSGGSEPQLANRTARFYFDSEHDFVLVLASKHLARIKVVVLRVLDLDEEDSDDPTLEEDKTDTPPAPFVAAKVRNFLESTLCELRVTWMRRLSYGAYLQCHCDRICTAHRRVSCQHEDCLHFLSLDECLSSKVVYCDHQRINTSAYRRGFPTLKRAVDQTPIFAMPSCNQGNENNVKSTVDLPIWVKSTAKMLNAGSEGQDWLCLAQRLGYKRAKVETFNNDANPGLALVTDWIVSSGNTALSVDMMVNFLEQMQRDDIVEIIHKGQEMESNPAQVFISYQWDVQDEVAVLRDVLERNGLTCWMDIGQMGGGDHLYSKIYEGIKNAKVTIACLTHKYLVSHYCNRELALADLLRKPIIPVMFESLPWPPGGAMSLIFSTLVYVNLKGVGGHGGSGIHADLDSKYEEIVMHVSHYTTPLLKPFVTMAPKSISDRGSSDVTSNIVMTTQQRTTSNPFAPFNSLRSEFQSSSRQQGPPVVHGYHPMEPNRNNVHVQQAHVAKCVVCTLL